MAIWKYVFLVVALFIVIQVLRTRHYISVGVALAEEADIVKYTQTPPNSTMRILIIGDSTVVGTGAEDPKASLAGRVGQTFPRAEVINRGVNGRKTKSLLEEIQQLEEKFDFIMLHTGGNDIVRFTNLQDLERDLMKLLTVVKTKATKVSLVSSDNIGTALLLPYGTRWLFTKRSREVRALFIRVSSEADVPYVDLFREPEDDPFVLEPDVYYSKDYFHPSVEGYGVWYERIEPVLLGVGLP